MGSTRYDLRVIVGKEVDAVVVGMDVGFDRIGAGRQVLHTLIDNISCCQRLVLVHPCLKAISVDHARVPLVNHYRPDTAPSLIVVDRPTGTGVDTSTARFTLLKVQVAELSGDICRSISPRGIITSECFQRE